MEYRVLGPLEVHAEGGALSLGGAKQRALLALLLLNANRVVPRARLVDELWGSDPPETAVASVQVYVSRLRKLLPPDALLTRASGYLLAAAPEEIDLQRFEGLTAEARAATPERASALFREALELWHGPALAGIEGAFAQVEGARLEDQRLAALEERIDADLALGRHDGLIGELEQLVREHPHRERLRGQLMLALYRAGRQAEALGAYRDARAALDELGLEPSERLRTLERQILTQDGALDAPRPLIRELSGLPGPLRAEPRFPFVGRERELDALRSLLRHVVAEGDGRVALVSGEAGGGKTRFVRTLACEAISQQALVLYGGAESVGAPYAPFVEVLEQLARVADPDALAQLAADRTELARVLPDVGEPPAPQVGDFESERRRLHGAVSALLQRAGSERPLLLILDDLHWADAASLRLFLQLAREVPERVLVLGTYRDRGEDVRPEFIDALAALARVEGLTRVKVANLNEDEVADFLRRATGARDDAAVSTLATAIQGLTDGTPFFLCELWRALLDEDAITTTHGAPRVIRPLAALESPEGVREVVQFRLSRLSAETNGLLEVAAIAGRQFDAKVLEAALAAPPSAALEEAAVDGIIEDLPGVGLSHRFTHELVRRAIVDRLSGARRASLHLQVGEALEHVHADDLGAVVTDLAHHFAHAASLGDVARAVDYNVRAADAATAAFALEDATRWLSTALELGISDERVRARVQLELARALWVTGTPHRAGEVLDDALESAIAAGDEQNEWYIRLERAGVRRDRSAAELVSLARGAIDVFGRLGDKLGLARAHRRIALAAADQCAFADVAVESERALAFAVAAGNRQEEARIVDALCTALLYGPAPAEAAAARCRELLDVAGSRLQEAVILSSLAGLDGMLGRFEAARDDYRRAEASYRELELPFFVAAQSAISGPVELQAGNPDVAETLLRDGIALLVEEGDRNGVAYRSALLALALLAQGRRDEAADALRAGEPVRLITRITHTICSAHVLEDVQIARSAVDLAEATQALTLQADARAALADVLAAQRSDEAEHQRRLALELFERKGNVAAANALQAPLPRV